MIERKKIVSSNIASIGYDPKNQILEVEFLRTSGVFRYYEVPSELYENLMKATSKGKFFHKNIRDKFSTSRVR